MISTKVWFQVINGLIFIQEAITVIVDQYVHVVMHAPHKAFCLLFTGRHVADSMKWGKYQTVILLISLIFLLSLKDTVQCNKLEASLGCYQLFRIMVTNIWSIVIHECYF